MKIVGKIKKEEYLTFSSLRPGECFHFKNEETLYMACRGGFIVNLENGDYTDIYEEGWKDKPIERKKAFVTIEN